MTTYQNSPYYRFQMLSVAFTEDLEFWEALGSQKLWEIESTPLSTS